MDGVFVPAKTWPHGDSEYYTEIVNQEMDFPFWDTLGVEADLMVDDPVKAMQDWISFGAKRIIIHTESLTDIGAFLNVVDELTVDKGSFLRTEIGMAINTTTSNEVLYPYIEQLDFVQCMGIEQIGFQSRPFDERVVEKITNFKEKFPELVISVDGGVKLDTAPRLLEAGASRLVVGSAIFDSHDVEEAIAQFEALV